MTAQDFSFVDAVAAQRGLVVTARGDHSCRLGPAGSDAGWYCDLDDGTPTADDRDPASSVRWVSPTLRARGPDADGRPSYLEASRPGPHSDLGRLVRSVGRLLGHPPRRTPEGGGRFVYVDPAGVLGDDLRRRIETWPEAMHGDGVVRPAELWSIKVTGEGLVVTSVSWWGSAPALDHQVGLGIDLAHRLNTGR